MNPRFENVTQMENVAVYEDDFTCNLRLSTGSWLRVVADEVIGFHYSRDGSNGRSTDLTRVEAQRFIDREWGRC